MLKIEASLMRAQSAIEQKNLELAMKPAEIAKAV
jgi:hypothetical protein